MSTVFEQLRDEQFISLMTFRRSGEPVSTPVWVAADGSALVVTTQLGTGKIKRLRHTSRVRADHQIRAGVSADLARRAHSGDALPTDRRTHYGANTAAVT